MESTEPTSVFFAPELFHSHNNDEPVTQESLVPDAPGVGVVVGEGGDMKEMETSNNDIHFNEEEIKQEIIDTPYPPLDDETMPGANSSIMDMVEETLQVDKAPAQDTPEHAPKPRKHPGRSRKVDPDAPPKSTVHSSKNEGQHTDRRYLCYLCNKLFTRRRSVRDHISKIHNTKTWEPLRSLEIIVEPSTGEPVEPLEDIIARGPPPPPPKPTKAEKAAKRKEEEEREEQGQDHDENDKPVEDEIVRVPAEPSPTPTSAVVSLKKEPSITGSRASSTEPFATPVPLAGKKRPASDDSGKPLSAAAKKKGTAKIKSSTAPNKRSKLSESEQSPPLGRSTYRSPSATPASTHLKPVPSKLKKQTSAASVKSSPPPSSRAVSLEVNSPSPSMADTPTSSNDDGEVFCICRKGDNHTWMIACDGGCDEWFHGNCVNIRERDGELIDKYICPNCTKPGLQTTWKRMCRRKDCRKPARVTQDPPSKYCSDVCGRMFFVELVQRGDPHVQTSRDGQYVIEAAKSKKLRKKHKRPDARNKVPKPILSLANGDVGDLVNSDSRLATPAYSDEEKTEYETDSSLDDDMLPNRGAALRAGEIKALLDRCKTIEDWRALGRKPDTPPREMDVTESKPPPLEFDDLETTKLASIDEEKRQLNERYDMLMAREAFLGLVKARSSSITEEVRKTHPKMKDVCGFDPRMSWCDEEFLTWYHRKGGKEILGAGAHGRIGPPDDNSDDADKKPNGINRVKSNSNPDSADEEEDELDTMPKKGGVCIKNRCPRHRNWAKGQLAELRFEQDLVRRALSRCETQENQIRERAMLKAWEMKG
ncbi:uncharacterized protein Z518_07970 [Rhinocladiella mackenziei CBS 650.93]|uniref:PHD-type domain-containing protein n=1 Tax=Rhinocladiella mackenziei CBS 650.93 TaxID=1442369 RepID=A0A0D2IFK2_9EURO|nr:uncharacterized protein Z518_07970 [Rhinocladiella mackenziei CBS 650.93]KIX02031.1 hypothetical protein Z518_07970 [Rhinocladiella mackenziei CBS 650.93]